MRSIWALTALGILLPGGIGMSQPSGTSGAARQEPLLALPLIEAKRPIFQAQKDKQERLRLTPGKHRVRIAFSLHDDPFHSIEEISPDKRTVRFRAPSLNETARPVSRVVEFVIEKGRAKVEKPEWGEALEGVQIRLRPAKVEWAAGEAPEFELDLRNLGKKSFAQVRVALFCHIELDDKWYVYRRPWVLDGAIARIQPGAQVDGWVQISLDARWVRKLPGD